METTVAPIMIIGRGAAVGDAHAVAGGDDGGAQRERDLRSAGGGYAGGERGEQQHADAAGQQDEACLHDGQAEAVAAGLGGLDELRGDEGVGVEGEPREQGGHVGQADARVGHQPQVDERAGGAQLVAPPQGEDDGGPGEQAEDGGAPPAPFASLGHREEQADQAGGEPEGAGDVEPARLAHRRLGYGPADQGDAGGAEDGGDPEHGVPVRVLDDQGGGRQAECGADADGAAHQRDGGAAPLRGQLVAQDADRQGHDGDGGALEGAGGDQQADVGGEGADHRPGGHEGEGQQQHPALAVHVAGAAEHGGEDGAGQQGRGDHPGDGRRGGPGEAGQVGQEGGRRRSA
ncbi:hypothetical protein GCM10020256_05570 [Streptomyces thermocoprophilus]